MSSGIYVIEDRETKECLYVGQSKDLATRKRKHLQKLKDGSHPRKDFVEWFKVAGEQRLKVIEVETGLVTDEELNRSEIWWFNKLKPKFYGKEPSLNETWVHSQATKDKIRNTLSGRVIATWARESICPRCKNTYKVKNPKTKFCSLQCSKLTHAVESYPPPKEVLEELYKDMTLREIGKVYGVSQVSVMNLCKKYGIVMRPKRARPKN